MNRFDNRTLNTDFINQAITKANELLHHDSAMMKELLIKNDFRFNSGTGYQVCEKIGNCTKVAPIFFYKPKWRWSKAIGYSSNGEIYLNSYKFKSLTLADLVANFCHEYCHIAGFNHGTGTTANYPSEEKNKFSVPYFVSSNISKWI